MRLSYGNTAPGVQPYGVEPVTIAITAAGTAIAAGATAAKTAYEIRSGKAAARREAYYKRAEDVRRQHALLAQQAEAQRQGIYQAVSEEAQSRRLIVGAILIGALGLSALTFLSRRRR